MTLILGDISKNLLCNVLNNVDKNQIKKGQINKETRIDLYVTMLRMFVCTKKH